MTVLLVQSNHEYLGFAILTLKGNGKGRYLGRFWHCSQVDLLYPCPQGVPSFISRGATQARETSASEGG
jgi:hypothetical protein